MKTDKGNIRSKKKPTCRDAVRCVFDLSPLEITIFRLLNVEGPMTAEKIGLRLDKDRSTAYRALRNLTSCQICYKEEVSLQKGGHQHIYQARSPEEVKDEMLNCLDDWYGSMRSTAERFPDELKKSLEEEGI